MLQTIQPCVREPTRNCLRGKLPSLIRGRIKKLVDLTMMTICQSTFDLLSGIIWPPPQKPLANFARYIRFLLMCLTAGNWVFPKEERFHLIEHSGFTESGAALS